MILFQYNTVANVDGTDGYATVGIQNHDHTDGLLYTYFADYPAGAAQLAAGRAIKFIPVIPQPMGTVQGVVQNASMGGAPIAGAQVRLLQNGRSFTSGADGRYAGSSPGGVFTMVASRAGFLPDTVGGVVVVESNTTTQDFSLIDNGGPEITDVTQIGSTGDTAGPYVINATIVDYSTVASAKLFYNLNYTGWIELPMTNTLNSYTASIPGAPAGSEVDYYVWAQDGVGHATVSPMGAPGSYYSIYITQNFYTYNAEDRGLRLDVGNAGRRRHPRTLESGGADRQPARR